MKSRWTIHCNGFGTYYNFSSDTLKGFVKMCESFSFVKLKDGDVIENNTRGKVYRLANKKWVLES